MKKRGFTLIEVMISVIILAVILGFAIPQWRKAITKTAARDAMLQLQSIFAANEAFLAATGSLWDTGGATANMDAINTTLELHLLRNSGSVTTYESADGSDYQAWVAVSGMTIRLDSPGGTFNICCESNNCPVVDGLAPSC